MYEYTVKFWYTNEEHFLRQAEETIYLDDKCSHLLAEEIVRRKRKRDFNQNIQIITVVCD